MWLEMDIMLILTLGQNAHHDGSGLWVFYV